MGGTKLEVGLVSGLPPQPDNWLPLSFGYKQYLAPSSQRTFNDLFIAVNKHIEEKLNDAGPSVGRRFVREVYFARTGASLRHSAVGDKDEAVSDVVEEDDTELGVHLWALIDDDVLLRCLSTRQAPAPAVGSNLSDINPERDSSRSTVSAASDGVEPAELGGANAQQEQAAVHREELLQEAVDVGSTSAPPTAGPSATQLAAGIVRQELKKQVFISHTGQDEHAKDFATSTLKPALEAAGLQVYMDYKNLELGSRWREELMDNAANSAVVVLVLSESFGKRFWCMLELDLALNARKRQQQGQEQDKRAGSGVSPLVIPVFYDQPDLVFASMRPWAETAAVRWYVTGKGQDDEELEEDWMELVQPELWVANMEGLKRQLQHVRCNFPPSDKDRNLQLANQVKEVAVKAVPQVLDVEADIVGFEAQEAHLLSLLTERSQPERRGLWLYGTGGSGKSTMATLLFNRLSGRFPHRAFIDIQYAEYADGGKHAENRMQGYLARALRHLGAEPDAHGPAAGLSYVLKRHVKDKKVLYVLDNVWNGSEVNYLLPYKWGEGSVVICTSRFQSFTDSTIWQQIAPELHHEPLQLLDWQAARQLFSLRCGLDPDAQLGDALACLLKKILKCCNGHPLALRLMGGQLYGSKDPAMWQSALAALKNGITTGGSVEDVLSPVLHRSMAGFSPEHVSMFLDVATVLRGEPLSRARKLWAAWHGPVAVACFADLKRRCLVTEALPEHVHLTERGAANLERVLDVHDVVMALGRRLCLQRHPGQALDEHFGSRIWMQDGDLQGWRQALQGKGVVAADLRLAVYSWEERDAAVAISSIWPPEMPEWFEAVDLKGNMLLKPDQRHIFYFRPTEQLVDKLSTVYMLWLGQDYTSWGNVQTHNLPLPPDISQDGIKEDSCYVHHGFNTDHYTVRRFSDEACLLHCGKPSIIQACCGLVVDAIQVTYGNVQKAIERFHGRFSPYLAESKFYIEDDDEIVRVDMFMMERGPLQAFVVYTCKGRWWSFGSAQENCSKDRDEGWVELGHTLEERQQQHGDGYHQLVRPFVQGPFFGQMRHGRQFDDGQEFLEHGRVSFVQLRGDTLLDKVCLGYGPAGRQVVVEHGGSRGVDGGVFQLADDDYIVKVMVKLGLESRITSLAFGTRSGRVYDPLGESEGVQRARAAGWPADAIIEEAPEGHCLAFMRGVVTTGPEQVVGKVQPVWAAVSGPS